MIIKRKIEEMGRNHLNWLDSLFHFSFDHYYDKEHMQFGVLRVLNDDLIKPESGFGMHPHKNMEIITYVIDGELTHGDSMGNQRTIKRGELQYMSAGTGVYHSEMNNGSKTSRTIQLWILPNQNNLTPQYGDKRFKFEDRINKWLHMVSNKEGEAEVTINQDANLYSTYVDEGHEISFDLKDDRQAYLVQLEGESIINNVMVYEKEAVMISDEKIEITPKKTSHYLLIEMKKSK